MLYVCEIYIIHFKKKSQRLLQISSEWVWDILFIKYVYIVIIPLFLGLL